MLPAWVFVSLFLPVVLVALFLILFMATFNALYILAIVAVMIISPSGVWLGCRAWLYAFQWWFSKDVAYFRRMEQLFLELNPTIFIDRGQVVDAPPSYKNVIYMLNYPSIMSDYFHLSLLPDASIIQNTCSVKAVTDLQRHLLKERTIWFPRGGGSYEAIKGLVEEHIPHRSLVVYPEGRNWNHRKSPFELGVFRSGMFDIAHKLDLTIVPILVSPILQKGLDGNGPRIISFLEPVRATSFETPLALMVSFDKEMNDAMNKCIV